MKSDPELEAEIARLPGLDITELRRRWKTLYGRPAPQSFRRNLLIKGVAYQMQVEAYGGLSPTTKRRLREIAQAVRNGNAKTVIGAPLLRGGTQLIRRWKGKTHMITALDNGFAWEGRTYRSLSAVAKAITGTSWNGYKFFGIEHGRQAGRPALESRQGTKKALPAQSELTSPDTTDA